jgi:hypothetical protein
MVSSLSRPPSTRRPLPVFSTPAAAEAPRLAALLERARELEAITSAITTTLPRALAAECTVANIRKERLVVLAHSASAATRLRLMAPQVLEAARQASGLALTELAVRVTATAPVPSDIAAEFRPLSLAGAEHLARAAQSVADPELRALFLKLASLA